MISPFEWVIQLVQLALILPLVLGFLMLSLVAICKIIGVLFE